MPGPCRNSVISTGGVSTASGKSSSKGDHRGSYAVDSRSSRAANRFRMGSNMSAVNGRMSMAPGGRMRGTKDMHSSVQPEHKVVDEEGEDRTPRALLSAAEAGLRPLASLLAEACGSSADDSRSVSRSSSLRNSSRAGGSRMPRASEGFEGRGGFQEEFPSPRGPGAKVQQELDLPAQRVPITIVWETDNAQEPEPQLAMVGIELDQPPEDHNDEIFEPTSRPKLPPDCYISREMQTLNVLQKFKETQSGAVAVAATECQINSYDIYDSQKKPAVEAQPLMVGPAPAAEPVEILPTDIVPVAAGTATGAGKDSKGRAADRRRTDRRISSFGRASETGDAPGRASARVSFAGGAMDGLNSAAGSPRGSMAGNENAQSVSAAGLAAALGSVANAGAPRAPLPAPVRPPASLSKLTGLLDALRLMHAKASQNTYAESLLDYRGLPLLPHASARPAQQQQQEERRPSVRPSREDSQAASSTAETPKRKNSSQAQRPGAVLKPLWDWNCDLTEGTNVTCTSWHQVNKDVLAVGYGPFAFAPQLAGRVALWSLDDPAYPSWTFPTNSGVTAVAFSHSDPHSLAVGLFDGTVALYNTRARSGQPTAQCSAGSGSHSDPVWALHWVATSGGGEQAESLVSTSTDGRVVQWSVTKGLVHHELMQLKAVQARPGNAPPYTRSNSSGAHASAGPAAGPAVGGGQARRQAEPIISRGASGMALSFSKRDRRLYLVATEEGLVHRCSTAYAEQYLDTYRGHIGPIYAVRWSPVVPGLFLTAGADWSVKLWDHDKESALLTFRAPSSHAEINDVRWCPWRATVFAAATAGGRVELWDIAQSVLVPAAIYQREEVEFTSVIFSEAPRVRVLVAGSNDGAVVVLKLSGLPATGTLEQQATELQRAIAASVST